MIEHATQQEHHKASWDSQNVLTGRTDMPKRIVLTYLATSGNELAISREEAEKHLLSVPSPKPALPEFELVQVIYLRVSSLWPDEYVLPSYYRAYPKELQARGGATIATFKDVATGELYTGVSICSKKDIFCKEHGRFNARGHAVHAYLHKLRYFLPETRFLGKGKESRGAMEMILREIRRQNPKAFFAIR